MDNIDHSQQYQRLFEGQCKKIQCAHEIIFNISARVISEDENGNDSECKEILTKNYHIPVKDKAEYKQFIDAFFQYLENCLSQSAKHAYDNTPTVSDNNE